MREAFGWDLEKFLLFGAYPGAAPLADELDRWRQYINDSLIETTLSRDILLLTRVDKPALLRRLFQLACNYSGQILAYQKMLGQLVDAGNTVTLAHYLQLLQGAGMVAGLQKFSGNQIRQRASSPKLQVLNTALMTAQSGRSPDALRTDGDAWGRLIESAVGAHLVNSAIGTGITVTYWRERNLEVDFVLQPGDSLVAIEVKSGGRTCSDFTKEDRQFLAAVQQIIADGRVGKPTIRKVKEAFDKTADPMEMLAILRRDIASQYLVAVPQKREKDDTPAPRELILSSYLP